MARSGRGRGHVSLIHATAQQTRCRPSSPELMPVKPVHLQLPHPGPSLLCCPGKGAGPTFQMLQQVRARLFCTDDLKGQLSCLLKVARGTSFLCMSLHAWQTNSEARFLTLKLWGPAHLYPSHQSQLYCAAYAR